MLSNTSQYREALIAAGRGTLSQAITRRGVGLHSGRAVEARLLPAPPESGLHINGAPISLEAVIDDRLATTLATPKGPVMMVEHLLAGLWLSGIDDAEIEVEGGEVPILDGSALSWYLKPQIHAPPPTHYPLPCLEWTGVSVGPGEGVDLEINLDYPALGPLRFKGTPWECLGARTFGFLEQAESLYAQGRALGAGLENTLIFEGSRCLNPEGPRWPNEPARHKALDLIGDLALMGLRFQGKISISRGGHALHHRLAQAILAAVQEV